MNVFTLNGVSWTVKNKIKYFQNVMRKNFTRKIRYFYLRKKEIIYCAPSNKTRKTKIKTQNVINHRFTHIYYIFSLARTRISILKWFHIYILIRAFSKQIFQVCVCFLILAIYLHKFYFNFTQLKITVVRWICEEGIVFLYLIFEINFKLAFYFTFILLLFWNECCLLKKYFFISLNT
jgi:hypothetical protein